MATLISQASVRDPASPGTSTCTRLDAPTSQHSNSLPPSPSAQPPAMHHAHTTTSHRAARPTPAPEALASHADDQRPGPSMVAPAIAPQAGFWAIRKSTCIFPKSTFSTSTRTRSPIAMVLRVRRPLSSARPPSNT